MPAQLRLPECNVTCSDWEFFARLSKEAGCLYIDLETTFNRSHEDAVRLTRGDPSVRLGRRITMIDRVWRADRQFLAQHRDRIDGLQRSLLLQAARQSLLTGRRAQARAHLKRASAISPARQSMNESMLRFLAGIPGSGLALLLARASLHGARQVAAYVSQR